MIKMWEHIKECYVCQWNIAMMIAFGIWVFTINKP
jgi:hypothetical protein